MLSQQQSKKVIRVLQTFAAKIVLEVFGGGGAIWGPAEVVGFRNPVTRPHWEIVCKIVTVCFGIRYLLQFIDAILGKERQEKNLVRLAQLFSAKLVLEWFGACGAVWGFSECLGLRIDPSPEFWRAAFWRYLALATGVVFGVRWLWQLLEYWHELRAPLISPRRGGRNGSVTAFMDSINGPAPLTVMNPHKTNKTNGPTLFASKFVLEVMGAVGAVWGFSDFMGWRVEETLVEWRIKALSVGVIFFGRYLVQLRSFRRKLARERYLAAKTPTPTGLQLSTSEFLFPGEAVEPFVDDDDDDDSNVNHEDLLLLHHHPESDDDASFPKNPDLDRTEDLSESDESTPLV